MTTGHTQTVKLRGEDVKNFLTRQRARIDPQIYGFSRQNRRVSGLRREEVAQLAAVSVSWYTWLEQGRDISISPAALQRIGKVLQLSVTEQEYLEALVFGNAHSQPFSHELPPEVRAMVDALDPHPAFVRRANMDIVYWNPAAQSLIVDWAALPPADRNSLKLMFISEAYQQRIHGWEEAARHTLSAFRAGYAASNQAQEFEVVIEDLLARSAGFRTLWNDHDVGKIGAGNKTLIDVEGRMQTYTFTSLQIEQAPGMHLIFYLAH
ncbi:helix-turn-helix transcriptional regulator [Pantoea dispersa]|uniref:helix-turn-helix transcriptional regulator n=1 Tax=Pantoea TaxID=53335 RepID=UPI00141A1727|nr:helix-turn-helix transcriptional regulator [Pantoea sp. Ap-870]NIE53244.1 helix-turn-helix domain-containing protein [Pantoea sp. Ap-870]